MKLLTNFTPLPPHNNNRIEAHQAIKRDTVATTTTTTLVHHLSNENDFELSYAEFFGNFYVQTVLCVLGLTFNLINCAVFSGKEFVGAAYHYMAALSLADTGALLCTLPIGLLRCNPAYVNFCSDNTFSAIRKRLLYFTIYVGYPLSQFFANLSSFITMILATERYLAMKYYHLNTNRCHRINARLVTTLISLLAFAINTPYFFAMYIKIEIENHTSFSSASASSVAAALALVEPTAAALISNASSSENSYMMSEFTTFGNSWFYSAFSWSLIFVSGFLPLFILCVANIMLLITVNLKPSKQRKKPRRLRAQRKLTLLLMTVIFLFLFGQIPRAFSNKRVFNVFYPSCKVKCYMYQLFQTVSVNLSLLSYSGNFLIYITLNKHFRRHFRSMAWCCIFCPMRKKISIHDPKRNYSQLKPIEMELTLNQSTAGVQVITHNKCAGQFVKSKGRSKKETNNVSTNLNSINVSKLHPYWIHEQETFDVNRLRNCSSSCYSAPADKDDNSSGYFNSNQNRWRESVCEKTENFNLEDEYNKRSAIETVVLVNDNHPHIMIEITEASDN